MNLNKPKFWDSETLSIWSILLLPLTAIYLSILLLKKKITKENLSPVLSYTTRSYTGDNSTVGFTVTNGTTVDDVLVTENGVLQKPTTDYTISGTVLTFGTAPAAGVQIVVRELP